MYSYRREIFIGLFIGLPIVAYVLGLASYPMFSKSEILVRTVSLFPNLTNVSEILRSEYGEPAELRSLVTSFYFIVVLAIQCIFISLYAVTDVSRNIYGHVLAVFDFKTIAAISILFLFAYFFFFPTSNSSHAETQIGRLFTETDLIYVLVAFIFRLFAIIPYMIIIFSTRAVRSILS
jgi:hypothetical protein